VWNSDLIFSLNTLISVELIACNKINVGIWKLAPQKGWKNALPPPQMVSSGDRAADDWGEDVKMDGFGT
jgi:hypothetical protein